MAGDFHTFEIYCICTKLKNIIIIINKKVNSNRHLVCIFKLNQMVVADLISINIEDRYLYI